MVKILLLLLACLLLAACSGGNGSDVAATPTPAPTQAAASVIDIEPDDQVLLARDASADAFVFVYNRNDIHMGADMADVLAVLGEPRRVFESPSCAFDGIDRVFAYPGIEIYTYPEGDSDFIHTVYFTDDSVATPEGLFLGSTLADMLDLYGNQYEQELGQYTFFKGETRLRVLLTDDGTVDAITYLLDLGM